MGLATLADALRWIEDHWDYQQPVPVRIHTHAETPAGRTSDRKGCECLSCSTDGRGYPASLGSPDFTSSFIALLDRGASGTERVTVRSTCEHPNRSTGLCSMCAIYDESGRAIAESGVYERTEERFRYPMSRALARLRSARADPGSPHPLLVVRALASVYWDRRRLDLWPDEVILRSLRQLEGRYQDRPPVRPWTTLSESQQNAEREPEGLTPLDSAAIAV